MRYNKTILNYLPFVGAVIGKKNIGGEKVLIGIFVLYLVPF